MSNADDEAALIEADDRFFARLNEMFTGKLGVLKALWSHSDDVIYTGPDGLWLIGWQAVLPDWEKQAAMKMGGSIEVIKRHVTIGQELAVVHDVAKATNHDADGTLLETSMRGTNVFRKEDGQ
jgi:ketosteroid isomerase-like protein